LFRRGDAPQKKQQPTADHQTTLPTFPKSPKRAVRSRRRSFDRVQRSLNVLLFFSSSSRRELIVSRSRIFFFISFFYFVMARSGRTR
jgi:hypothetical protein